MIKIAILCTESSGKTTLATGIADYFGVDFVEEFAREYLTDYYQKNQQDDNQKQPYSLQDIENIAKKQYQNIQNYQQDNLQKNPQQNKKHQKLLIADTELIVTKIWAENSFKTVPKWILEHIEKQNFDLYLLTNYEDITWEYDPLREHQALNERKMLFESYKNELEKYKFSYEIISGENKEIRLKKAVEIIEKLL